MRRMYSENQIKEIALECVNELIENGSIAVVKSIEYEASVNLYEVGQDVNYYTGSIDIDGQSFAGDLLNRPVWVKTLSGLVIPAIISDDLTTLTIACDSSGSLGITHILYI